MKSWRDEWKTARLHLQLRGSQLFHGALHGTSGSARRRGSWPYRSRRPAPRGCRDLADGLSIAWCAGETVTLDVCVESPATGDAPASSADGSSPGKDVGGLHARAALLQHGQDRCGGATVDVKVVADEAGGRRRDSSSPHPSTTPRHGNRQTLFHQEAELSVVEQGDGDDGSERFLLRLRAQVELKVRSEHWDRPLALIARVTPKETASGDYSSLLVGAEPLEDPAQTGAVLSDEWLASQLLPLIREETTPPASLTRRLECSITVVKPLHVQVETRALPSRRVAVVVKAHNARADMGLEVLDLQLHLSASPPGPTPGRGPGESGTRRYVLLDASNAPFPVSLLPQERYNFLFVLEPSEPPVREPDAADTLPGAAVSGKTSGSEPTGMLPAGSTPLHRGLSRGSAGPGSPDGLAGDEGPEHALLTLTWKMTQSAARAITEQHTIVWSPFALAAGKPPAWPAPPRAEWSHFVVPQASAAEPKPVDAASVSFVTLRDDSPLLVALVPPASPPRVGDVATACIAVTNRSARATFDLTLVLPFAPWRPGRLPQDDVASPPSWVSFEASHHLGYVSPAPPPGPRRLTGLCLFVCLSVCLPACLPARQPRPARQERPQERALRAASRPRVAGRRRAGGRALAHVFPRGAACQQRLSRRRGRSAVHPARRRVFGASSRRLARSIRHARNGGSSVSARAGGRRQEPAAKMEESVRHRRLNRGRNPALYESAGAAWDSPD